MPTYGYECLSCKDQIEVFQSIKDDPLSTCESCGGSLRKRVYPVGISFKGSGFYVNDYAAKSEASSPASAPTTEAAKSEGSGEAKTETKPDAAKTEPKTELKTEAKTPVAAP